MADKTQTDVIEITQVRSTIGAKQAQRRTLRALGLRRIRQTVSHPDRPEIRGMLAKVAHLVAVRHPGDDEPLDLARRAVGLPLEDLAAVALPVLESLVVVARARTRRLAGRDRGLQVDRFVPDDRGGRRPDRIRCALQPGGREIPSVALRFVSNRR